MGGDSCGSDKVRHCFGHKLCWMNPSTWREVRPCEDKYSAAGLLSRQMYIRTWTPVTFRFLATNLCTYIVGRWNTRLKPSVGTASISPVSSLMGVVFTHLVSSRRSVLTSTLWWSITLTTDGSSSIAISRCSTVMISWRFIRASAKALASLISRSWSISYIISPVCANLAKDSQDLLSIESSKHLIGREVKRDANKKTPERVFFLLIIGCYFLAVLPAFLASISCLAARRAFDLYGRVLVFFFGLNAIIRVI